MRQAAAEAWGGRGARVAMVIRSDDCRVAARSTQHGLWSNQTGPAPVSMGLGLWRMHAVHASP